MAQASLKQLEKDLFEGYPIKKNYKQIIQHIKSVLLDKETQPKFFELLKTYLKTPSNRVFPSFKYFLKIFGQIRHHLSFKKFEEPQKTFLNLVIQYSRKYITSHFDDKQKLNFNRLYPLFSNINTDILVEYLTKNVADLKLKDQNLLVYIIVYKRNQPEKVQEFILQKLTTDYLIDIKKQTASGYKFTKLQAGLFTPQIYREKILPLIQKLVRRSELNLKTFLTSLMCNIDYSECSEEIVLKNIKDFYTSKDVGRVALAIAQRVCQKTENPETQIKLLEGLKKHISSTNSEDLKYEFLLIITSLAQASPKKNDKVIQAIINFLLDNLTIISTEPQTIKLDNYLNQIFKNISENFKIDDLQKFSKNISTAKSNKFGGVVLCKLYSLYLKNASQETLQSQKQDLIKISTQIFTEIFKANLKDSKKLVTNSFIFVSSLETVTETLKLFQDEESLKNDLFDCLKDLFAPSIFTTKLDFFNANSNPEITTYFASIVNILYIYPQQIQEKLPEVYKILQYNILYLLTNTKVSSQVILRLFQTPNIHVFNLLQNGLFYYIYLVYPYEIEHFQSVLHKVLLTLNILLKFVQHFDQSKQLDSYKEFTYFHFLINNTILSKQNLIKKYKNIVKQNPEIFIENLQTSQIAQVFNSYLLISQKFIQSPIDIIKEGSKGITQIILDLQQYNILLPYKMFTEPSNYEDSSKLIDFQQDQEKAIKSFTDLEAPHKQTLIQLNILKNLDGSTIEQEEEKKAEPIKKKGGAPPKKGGKPPGKKPAPQQQQAQPKSKEEFLMLDEEELLAKKLREHKQNMFKYYTFSVEFLSLLGTVSNPKSAIQFFFEQFMDGFLSLCENQDFHKLFRKIALSIFSQIKGLQDFREGVADFTLKYSETDLPNDKIMTQFQNFQEWILSQQHFSQTLPSYLIHYIHRLQKYTLTKSGFAIEIKKLCMDFYIKLDETQYLDQLLEIFLPLNNSMNILASQQNTQDLLDKLVKNLKNTELISHLFRDILNNMDKAKLLVLQCLFDNSKSLNFQPTFDDIIKLRILIIDDNPIIRELAQKTLDIFPHQINSTKISTFDLNTFVLIHSRENTEKFTKFANELMQKNPDLNKVFFQKVVSSAQDLYDNEEISEESLLFFPYFLDININFISGELMEPVFQTLVEKYTLDGKEIVSKDSLQKGIDIIQTHGPRHASHIIQILEKFLKSSDDQHQLSSIIYLGVIAPYIKNKASVEGVSQKILNLFEKGSQNMQKNLARCMPELINFFDSPKKIAVTQLNDISFHSNPQKKRGCCYLVAGLNKGLGVGFIKELDIFGLLKGNSDLKKDKPIKEATIYLIQAYLETFERVLEPYIIDIAEIIMHFFTDRSEEIRDLALETIKLMMKKLTSFGVKIVLPQMLKGLEEPQWQAKCNNIWSLGNMAYCSAKQLSQCLPQIVPKLSYCLSDTHPKIREAANEALNNIGSTIQNPEISQIVDILIQALSDPFEKNKQGLKVLLQTKFEHYIDAPSLSLVIPILDYALKQKHDADAKIDACQVIGSISALIKDITDILPYMNILIQGISSALGDPESDVRTFGAKAVGKMAGKLGQQNCSTYFKFIQDLIEDEATPSIERGGAASAQAEIMCALGGDYFKLKFQEVFQKIKSKHNHMKEGYIGLFVYLPIILKDKFQPYIKTILENIVEYVTYDYDKVRDVALRVLKILIQSYGLTETEMLMQPIMEGMFSMNWRKRNSSIILSGEMLEVLTRYTKISEGESYTEDQKLKIDYRNQCVMGIYILRSDENDQIRNSSTNVWKMYVDNTPRTMKQALYAFFDKLCYSIMLIPEIAATSIKCVKDFASKYGESFFHQIMEEVDNKINENKDNIGYITGLLLVLREIMLETNVQMATRYKDEFIQLLKDYLFTQDKKLRDAVFRFYKVVVDKISSSDILENIVAITYKEFQVLDESSEKYTDYLEIFNNICRQKSQKILTYITPFLFQTPLQMQQIDILTNNAEIIGKEVYRMLQKSELGGCEIMLEEAFKCQDPNLLESICYCLEQLSINLVEDDMIKFYNYFMEKLKSFNNNIEENQNNIIIILSILNFYYYNTVNRINYFNDSIMQSLLPNLFLNPEKYGKIILKTNEILKSFYGAQERKIHYNMVSLTNIIFQNHIEKNKTADNYLIPGLNIGEKGSGIAPYIDMIISCLVFNCEQEFDKCLELIENILLYTDVENLNIHIMKIVGPLIRVSNYKYEQERKEVIVHLLHIITEKKMDISCFATQLQSTYLKLITEFPREEDFIRKISQNVVRLLDFNKSRKDVVLHQVHQRFRDENNLCVKHAYIVLLQKYIKTEIVEQKHYFARALLEKLFDNFTKIHQKDKLNNNILFVLVKLVGYLSTYAHINHINDYQTTVLQMLEDESESPIETFYGLSNLIGIYLYNPNFTENSLIKDQEEKLQWSSFKPLQNVQQLLEKNIGKFDKEVLTFFLTLCKKCIKKSHTLGKYLKESIDFSALQAHIDQELLQFNDVVELLK